jgi:hypothetical protein
MLLARAYKVKWFCVLLEDVGFNKESKKLLPKSRRDIGSRGMPTNSTKLRE